MEEYIYILIGVIWLAASVYKATKKGKKQAIQQKPGTTPQTEEGQSVPGVRSLLDELMGGQEVMVPEPESREYSIAESQLLEMEQEKPKKSFQSEYANLGLKGLETFTGEEESSPSGITFIDQFKDVHRKGSKQKKINLRKAIIYGAILERPYS